MKLSFFEVFNLSIFSRLIGFVLILILILAIFGVIVDVKLRRNEIIQDHGLLISVAKIAVSFCVIVAVANLYVTVQSDKYTKLMSLNQHKIYNEVELYKETGVNKAKGNYRIDLHQMDKELYRQLSSDFIDPFEYVIVEVPTKK